MMIRLYAYAAAVVAFVALAFYGHHLIWQAGHDASEAEWKVRWDARDLAELRAIDKAHNEAAAKDAEYRSHNEEVDRVLAAKNADIAAAHRDADLARRLLAAAAGRPAPAGGAVQQTPDQPGTSQASGTAGDAGAGRLPGLLASAFSECRRNADRLDALNAQLDPQVGP